MKSMTGYGSSKEQAGAWACRAEIKSVNNRYLEIQTRMPHFLAPWEAQVKKAIEACVSRGKVDIWLEVSLQDESRKVEIDRGLVRAYLKAHSDISALIGASAPLSAEQLMSAEGVLQVQRAESPEAAWKVLRPCLEAALARFDAVRIHDGQATKRDLEKQLGLLGRAVRTVRKRARGLVPQYAAELARRLEAMTGRTLDPALVLSEAAIIAGRTDVNEELQRLESHIVLFGSHLSSGEPCGKILDFIAQEMNREINTVGSKQNDLSVSNEVISMKAILEKIREQARNIE